MKSNLKNNKTILESIERSMHAALNDTLPEMQTNPPSTTDYYSLRFIEWLEGSESSNCKYFGLYGRPKKEKIWYILTQF